MKMWREFAHKDLRAQWKDSALERLHEISSVILMSKFVDDLEQTYVMKQHLNEAQGVAARYGVEQLHHQELP
jgi:hypothetical protein